jgi:hypothetical protein
VAPRQGTNFKKSFGLAHSGFPVVRHGVLV